jgi:hypothetical protein
MALPVAGSWLLLILLLLMPLIVLTHTHWRLISNGLVNETTHLESRDE